MRWNGLQGVEVVLQTMRRAAGNTSFAVFETIEQEIRTGTTYYFVINNTNDPRSIDRAIVARLRSLIHVIPRETNITVTGGRV